MPLPVNFQMLPEGDNPASLLDQQFGAVSNLVFIPCQAVGTNDLALTPYEDAPDLPAYTDLAPYFSFIAPDTSTGSISIDVAQLGAHPVFKDGGQTPASTGDLVKGLLYQAVYVASLEGGAGGFVLSGGLL